MWVQDEIIIDKTTTDVDDGTFHSIPFPSPIDYSSGGIRKAGNPNLDL